MLWRSFVLELRDAIPWVVNGALVCAVITLSAWVGWRCGWRRGIHDRAEKWQEQLTQARYEKTVAEERLDNERKISKRFELALQQLVEGHSLYYEPKSNGRLRIARE